MKILHLNMAYGQNFKGNFRDIFRQYRYFLKTKRNNKKFVENFLKLIKQEDPDIIFLTEIKKNDFLLIESLKKSFPHFQIQSKYKPHLRESKMKFSKHNGNGFFSKIKPQKINFSHLNHGRKSLILNLEIKSPKKDGRLIIAPTNFILGHFSLSKKIRQKQFLEIYQNLNFKKNNIICGDFNNYFGLKEFEVFTKNKINRKGQPQGIAPTNNIFIPAIKEKTFPASYPLFCLDNFLIPPNLEKNFKSKVCKRIISDHRAIVLEVN